MDIRNNIARVSKVEITKAEEFGARLALHLQIELRSEQLEQFVEGKYAAADRAVYAQLYREWRAKYDEAEQQWQDRTNRIMSEYNAACESAEEDGRPRPKPPFIPDFIGPMEPTRIKASRPCNSLAGWFVDLRAELTKADYSVVSVELGAKTKGKPKLVTEGEMAMLELRLDERNCERTAERDEVWEWLQLAGREFRVFGAQITLDEAIESAEPDRVAALLRTITEHVAEYTRTAGVLGSVLFHQELVSTIVGVRAARGEMLGPEGMAQLVNDLATIEHGDRGEKAAREVAGFVRRKLQAAIDKEAAGELAGHVNALRELGVRPESKAQPDDWRNGPAHVADKEVMGWQSNTSGAPDMNALDASVEADLRAKGHDVAVEAVELSDPEKKPITQWMRESGVRDIVAYSDAYKASKVGRNRPDVHSSITREKHEKVIRWMEEQGIPFREPSELSFRWAEKVGVHHVDYVSAAVTALGREYASLIHGDIWPREHALVVAQLEAWGAPLGKLRTVRGESLEVALERSMDQSDQEESEDTDRTPAYWADIAGVLQDDYMAALQALEPWTSWDSVIPVELHEKAVGLLERWAERDNKRDEQTEAERRDFGVCKTANTWAREAGVNGKAYVRTAIALGVFPDDASPVRVKFNESTHLRVMAAMSGEQPAA